MEVSTWSSSDSSLTRKSAFASAIEKFTTVTTSTFTRHKSSAAETFNQKKTNNPLPPIFIADGGSRPTSFFTALSRISPRMSSAHEPIQQRSRKLSTRLSQRPFWTRRNTIPSSISVPVLPPSEAPHGRMRESTATIVEHRLMAPLDPPIPRSKTLDVLPRQIPNTSPRYASPTTSSLAKRTERVMSHERKHLQSKTPTLGSSTMTTSRKIIHTNRTLSSKKDFQDITPSTGSLRVIGPSQAKNTQLRVSKSRKRLEHRTPTPGPSKAIKSLSANSGKHKKSSEGNHTPGRAVPSGISSTYEIITPDLGRANSVIHGHLTSDQPEISDVSVSPTPSLLHQSGTTSLRRRNSSRPRNMSNTTPTASNMCSLPRTPSGRSHTLADAGLPKTPTKRYLMEQGLLQTSPSTGTPESSTTTAPGERSSATLEDPRYSLSPKTLKILAEVKERRRTSGNSSPSYRDPATLHNSWSPSGSKFGVPIDEEEAKKSLQQRGISLSSMTPTKALDLYFDAQMNAIPGGSTDSLLGGVDSTPTPKLSNPRLIHTALDSRTWSGRVTGLSDRLRSEDLNAPPPRITPSPTLRSSEARSSYPGDSMMHDDELRYQRVFNQLHSLCTTAEARQSLAKYQQQFWTNSKLEKAKERGEVRPPVPKKDEKEKEEAPVRQVVVGKMAMKDKMRQKFKRNSGSFGLIG